MVGDEARLMLLTCIIADTADANDVPRWCDR